MIGYVKDRPTTPLGRKKFSTWVDGLPKKKDRGMPKRT